MSTEALFCPDCEEVAARPALRDCAITHDDRNLVVNNLECYRCGVCGTEQVRPDQIRRNQMLIADARRRADGLLTGHEIKAMSIDRAALDDVTLVSLQAMRNTLLRRLRDPESQLTDDYRAQLRAIDEEILQRTARFAHNAGQPWSAAEDSRLQRLARAGETIECIASTLGRTCNAIVQRSALHHLEFRNDGTARSILRPTDPIDGRGGEPNSEQQRDSAFVRQVAAARGAL